MGGKERARSYNNPAALDSAAADSYVRFRQWGKIAHAYRHALSKP
jgi:hypothetical protein